MVALTAPGRTIPMPTAPADWSPPPATTGVPAVRPTSAAAAGESRPVISGPSYSEGRSVALSSAASSIWDDQRRCATSSSSVPEASAMSVARSPVSLNRT